LEARFALGISDLNTFMRSSPEIGFLTDTESFTPSIFSPLKNNALKVHDF